MGKGAQPEGIEKIIRFFNNRPEDWTIKIAGGEITIHPQFIYLCQKLSEKHNIQMISNGSISFERLDEFCDKINSNHVNYFSCSLQPFDEEGERFENFFKKIMILKKHGYKVNVSYVAAKNRLDKIRSLKKTFEDAGIRFSVKVLITDKGKVENYTEEEIALLDEVMDTVTTRYNLDGEFQNVYGTPCDYGFTKVQIHGDTGDIMACRKYSKPIGNIYTGELTLKNAPVNCPFEYCDCVLSPLNNINKNNFKDVGGSVLRYHYDKTLYKQFKNAVANPYYQNFNWNPVTADAKLKSLESLKEAEKAGRMFYKAYKLMGDLYRDMGKLNAAGRAYKKAITLEPDHDGSYVLLKQARFMALPFPIKISVSLLRKIFHSMDKYYGYAEKKVLEEMQFFEKMPNVPVYGIDSMEFVYGSGGIFRCGKMDPQIYLTLPHPLEKPSGIPLCEINFTNTVAGNLQIFWDYGEGLNEENSTHYVLGTLTETVSVSLPVVNWKNDAKFAAIRIDPPDGTTFVLKSIKILEDR
jgi:tetratricopeptide (TPR) repeat protein